jgi:hypothetical protein
MDSSAVALQALEIVSDLRGQLADAYNRIVLLDQELVSQETELDEASQLLSDWVSRGFSSVERVELLPRTKAFIAKRREAGQGTASNTCAAP